MATSYRVSQDGLYLVTPLYLSCLSCFWFPYSSSFSIGLSFSHSGSLVALPYGELTPFLDEPRDPSGLRWARLVDDGEWLIPGTKEVPTLPLGYMGSFVCFHEQGLAFPLHPFTVTLFKYLQVQLHYLNPNRILHIAAFITLCEGYLGMSPTSLYGDISLVSSY